MPSGDMRDPCGMVHVVTSSITYISSVSTTDTVLGTWSP